MFRTKFSQRIGLCWLILIAVLANVSWAGAPVHTRLLYENSLQGETDDAFAAAENHGGTFTAGGWRTERDSKLTIQLKDRLPAVGSVEFSVTNFDPLTQTTNGKQTFFALTSRPHTKISLFYEDTLSAFVFLRTGIDYIVGDKCNLELDPAFHGVRSRTDYRDILVNSKWNTEKTYRFKFVWDQYFVWVYLDGQEVKKLDFKGPVERFQHISIGGDDIYHSIIGPVYSNLKIYTAETTAQFDDKSFTKNIKGLDAQKGGHGIAVADLNNDGLDDMVISNYADDVNLRDLVYIQQPDHTFIDEADRRGLPADVNSFSSLFADLDHDGDLDLFKCRVNAENKLYMNDGQGYFTDEGRGRGIHSLAGKTSSAAAFDADQDGDIDLLAVNQNSKHEMYINDGNGYFSLQDRGFRAGAAVKNDMPTVSAVDFDNDGDADIYINWPNQKNELYVNDGKGYFTERAEQYNMAFTINSQSVSFTDFDKDGDPDLFVPDKVNAYTTDSLDLNIYKNDGSGHFTAYLPAKKLTMNGYSAQLFDADNDGNLDIYCLQNNLYDRWCVKPRVWKYFRTSMGRLYLGDSSGNFSHAGAGGADIIGYDARSFVANDFDQDGELDIYFTAAMFENVYLHNSSDLNKNWLELTVVGPRGDWGGLGSKIWLYQSGHLGDKAYLLAYDEVFPHSGYLASNNIRRHFGLGKLTACDILIKRTDGSVQTRLNVPANQRLVLTPDVLSLFKVSGDNQSATVNQMLPQPLVVQVLNQQNQPMDKVPVHLTIVQGSGVLQGAVPVLTNSQGLAQVFVMAGNEPGPLTIEAAVESALNSPQRFTAHIQSVTHVYSLLKISGDNQSGIVGKMLTSPFVVQVSDESGQPSIGHLVTFAIMNGTGNFYGETTFQITTDNIGKAAALLSLGHIAYQTGTVNVTAENVNSQLSFRYHSLPDLPDSLTILGGNNQQGDPQTHLPQPLVVQLHDQYRNAIAAFPILFSVVVGDCAVNGSAQTTATTDSNGVASVNAQLGTTAGESIIRAVAGSTAAEFHLFTKSRQPDLALSTLTATSPVDADGQSVSVLSAMIVDSAQKPLADIEVDLQAFGEGIILNQPNRTTDAQGRVIGSLASSVPGPKLVVARVMPQNELLTQTVVVNFVQPEMAIVIVSGDGQEVIVGQKAPLPLTIRMTKNGQPLPSSLIRYRIKVGDGHFEGGDSLTMETNAEGISAAPFFLGRKAGLYQVRAYPLSVPEKSVIFTLHGRADEASKLIVKGGDRQTVAAAADLPAPLAVQVYDEYDNPVGSASVLFSAVDDGTVLTPQPILTDSAGYAGCMVRLGSRGGIYTFKAELINGQFVLFQATATVANQAPRIISMTPSETTVRYGYYRLLHFEILQVIDAEGDPIRFAWRLNDHLIGIESHTALYTDPTLPESSILRCTVSDGVDSTFVEWNLIYSPETAVALNAFQAVAEGQNVMLRWAVPSVADIACFELYRDQPQKDAYQLICRQALITTDGKGQEFQFLDQSTSAPGIYHYQLVAVFKTGGKKPFDPISVEIMAPSDLTLYQNYPNPFNPTTLISFDLPESGQLRLIIFDQSGRQVRELINNNLPAGRHTYLWDGCDDQGSKVSSGSYFYELITAHEKLTRRLTMIK